MGGAGRSEGGEARIRVYYERKSNVEKYFVFCNRRNFHDEKQYTYTCLHWHHDMVMDLAFTVSGKATWIMERKFRSV